MDGLAFLPSGDVKDIIAYLKNIVSEEAETLLNYFHNSIHHTLMASIGKLETKIKELF